jgi:hypothetical protein
MNAAELRALAKDVGCEYWPNDGIDKFAQAAEILELLAWAEEFNVGIERDGSMWCVYSNGVEYGGKTLIGTLRLAREAAR